jgi:hypothetical protein
MVAVEIIAVCLVDFRCNLSWWAVKPALYFVLIPVASATLAMRSAPRRLVVLATMVNTLLLVGWYQLRRPEEGIVVGWSNPEYVRDIIRSTSGRLLSDTV